MEIIKERVRVRDNDMLFVTRAVSRDDYGSRDWPEASR